MRGWVKDCVYGVAWVRIICLFLDKNSQYHQSSFLSFVQNWGMQCFSITPPPESSFKFNLDWFGSFLTFHSSVWIEFWLNLIFWHNLKQIISFVLIICVPCWCRRHRAEMDFYFWKNEIDDCTADIVSIKLCSENMFLWKFYPKKS